MALLQPSPEVFQLFDDVMLLSDGMCVYFGPREGVLPFFENQGFRCPPRMPVPGFLQNITSRRDQKVGRSYQPSCCTAEPSHHALPVQSTSTITSMFPDQSISSGCEGGHAITVIKLLHQHLFD